MNYLLASLLILAVGPLLYHGFRNHPKLLDGVGAFVVVSLCGLILFEILPELWKIGGFWVVPALFAGLAGPTLAEKAFHHHSKLTHNLTLALGIGGLLLHTLTDGSAIFLASENEANVMLAIGVILHRLPAGLAIWWLLRPQFGPIVASATLFALMVTTVIGFYAGAGLLHGLTFEDTVYLQAFVTGSIVHVLLHRPHEHDQHGANVEHQSRPFGSGHYLGSAIGLFFVVMLMLSHHEDDHEPEHHHAHHHHSDD